jgi:hypothetical protein
LPLPALAGRRIFFDDVSALALRLAPGPAHLAPQ